VAKEGVERRLTTILAADVVGYSRLMGQDEVGTLGTLKAHRRELIDPKAAQYGGRTIKLMGDGALMEFASVVDAVAFAVEVQAAMAERNQEVPEDRRLVYRMGINIGDIIVEGDDIYGDGVNIAARLEGLADPGGICISRSVHTQIAGKLDLEFEDLGEQQVKNIAKPVMVYRVALDERAAALVTPITVTPPTTGLGRGSQIAAGLVFSLVVVAGLVWWQPWAPDVEPASVEAMAFPLPDKPSIAVLPFTNMSDDPGQDYFADGMTDDLITDLSKLSGLFVIARNSSFSFKGQQVKVRKVAEELGVRYVLEGSVRRAGNQVRINAQLIDATTGGHIWADRFDGNVTNIFAAQDEFVLKIVKALELRLSEREKSEIEKIDTNMIEARAAFQRGWALYSRFNAQDNARAESHLKKAIELDPEYGRAHGALALVYFRGGSFGWHLAMGRSAVGEVFRQDFIPQFKKAKQYPTALVHVAAALQHLRSGRGDEARVEAGRAIAMQPNDPEAHIVMAWGMIASGKPKEGLSFVRAAMRLNPSYPSHYVLVRGMALYGMGNLEGAARAFEEGIERETEAIELIPLAASIFAQLGRRQDAREAVIKWRPGVSQRVLQNAPSGFAFPFRWEYEFRRVRERLIDGLRVAVLPLETTVSSLLGELKRGPGYGRAAVVQTLGRFGPAAAAAVPDLIEALGDEQEDVREQAVIALGKIGPDAKAAIPALSAIKDDEIVGFYATDALKEISGR
jgi:adenylate cyclase